jgi:hypothetical protein
LSLTKFSRENGDKKNFSGVSSNDRTNFNCFIVFPDKCHKHKRQNECGEPKSKFLAMKIFKIFRFWSFFLLWKNCFERFEKAKKS